MQGPVGPVEGSVGILKLIVLYCSIWRRSGDKNVSSVEIKLRSSGFFYPTCFYLNRP